ncbi:2-hydroxychromene-2-carboxylate isomerase [Reyranella sp.]|jgi:2-hydroxychromene-2-carboxylate isomerase|uniref:2-hydroxychromene-2-carboxylate isomerase n=1 Tax=Reyranella sp. TaxID=1929291 RepID=UPI002F95A12B
MADDAIHFWFSTGSTYTYLSVSRIEHVASTEGVRFDWRPFSVRAIMREQNNIPFAGKPVKSAYMWRDLERRAAMYHLPIKVPAPYPLKEFDLANRLVVLGLAEGWGKAYAMASYRRWLADGQEPGCEPNLSASLRELGQDPARCVERANGDDVVELYEAATDEARELGIFGSPTFAVGRELFWGDDRLDDALSWFRHGRLVS